MRRLWYHGKVDTMVPGQPRQEAVGVENGTIVFVGSDRDALALPWDEKHDLNGRQVLPGFNDTHMHLLLYALFRDSLPLTGVSSIRDIIAQGRARLAKTGAPYLLGMGWNQETLAEGRMPTRADLDQISREVPVCLLRCCAHVAACNTPMLERLKTLTGVEAQVLDQVDFDQGLLREEAMRLYMQVVPPLSDGQVKDLIRKGQADANAKGLTCVHSDDLQVLPGMDPIRLTKLFREMERDGELTLRIYEQCLLSSENFERFLPHRSPMDDRISLFRTGPRKLLQDGSLGARTALLRDGYQGDPSWKGVAVHSPQELEELIGAAHRARMDVAVHTIGDRALEQLCQAVEHLQALDPWPQARHGAVHAQITDPALLERMKALGLQAYIQPIFIEADMGIITQRVGEARARNCYNWRSMLELGLAVSGGSDCPVEPFDVLDNLRAAVTRRDRAGERVYLPEQALSLEEGLSLFTSRAAWCSRDEKVRGQLRPGMQGDLVILEGDLSAVPPQELPKVSIAETVLGGKTVFSILSDRKAQKRT